MGATAPNEFQLSLSNRRRWSFERAVVSFRGRSNSSTARRSAAHGNARSGRRRRSGSARRRETADRRVSRPGCGNSRPRGRRVRTGPTRASAGGDQRRVGSAVGVGRRRGHEPAAAVAVELVKLDPHAHGGAAAGDVEDVGGQSGQGALRGMGSRSRSIAKTRRSAHCSSRACYMSPEIAGLAPALPQRRRRTAVAPLPRLAPLGPVVRPC